MAGDLLKASPLEALRRETEDWIAGAVRTQRQYQRNSRSALAAAETIGKRIEGAGGQPARSIQAIS